MSIFIEQAKVEINQEIDNIREEVTQVAGVRQEFEQITQKAEELKKKLENRIEVTEGAVDVLGSERLLVWLEFDPEAAVGKRYGNSENHKNLKAWLKDPDKGNLKGVPVTFFLKGAKYAEARSKAVSELIPTP